MYLCENPYIKEGDRIYNVTIIGAGVSGVFLAYTLMKEHPHLSVHVIDRGKPLAERFCGQEVGESCTCKGSCDKYVGFAGLGKSEGKFNYTNDFGGILGQKIGTGKTMALMEEVDQILCSFGGDGTEKYSTKNHRLSEKAASHGLNVFSTEVRHLGTSLAKEVFQNMYEAMKDKIRFSFEVEITEVEKRDDSYIIHSDGNTYESEKVIIATGISGSEWLEKVAPKLGIKPAQTRLDLGVRVEMRGNQLDAILQETFETKLNYHTDSYSATTYCMNPRGRVIRKHQHGLVMADGQNQREEDQPSENLNFTLFVPRLFPSHKQAMEKAASVLGNINKGRGRIVAQRLDDLYKDTPTATFQHNSITPSLDADAGNLREEVPELYIGALLDFFQALEGLLEEPIDRDTILYGLDSKFYEAKIETDENFETNVPGLFLIGDCSGETHSLSQAAASGVYLGRVL